MRFRPANLIPRRRRHWVLLGVLVLLVVAWFGVPQLFVPTIRAKLQGMISGHLDARLEIGRMMYAPPWGVRARDVRLVSGDATGNPGVELLKVRKLDLKLARHPFHDGPLVIENITVTDPEAHFIRTPDGRLVGMHGLVKEDAPTVQATQPAQAPAPDPDKLSIDPPAKAEQEAARAKLSDMFELRHFGIKGGRIVYEDRTVPGEPPVVWKDLSVGMETTPKSKAVYGYSFEAQGGDVATLKSSGSFDLDQLVLDVGSLRIEARATPDDRDSPLPAQVQRVLRDYRVEGTVVLDADGRFPVRDKEAATFRAAVELRDASAYSHQWDATLDRLHLKLAADNRAAAGATGREPLRLTLESFEAASGDSTARLDKASIVLDRATNGWAVADVSGRLNLGGDTASLPKKSRPALAGLNARGEVQFTVAAQGKLAPRQGEYFLMPEDLAFLVYPRGTSLSPGKSPAPLRDMGGGGSIRKDKGSRVVVAENLTFHYGDDPILLTSARLPLPADLRELGRSVRIEEISGTVDFHRPGPRYPGKFGKVIDALRPVGPFTVGRDSWYAVTKVDPNPRVRPDPASPPRTSPGRKSDWYFSVATDNGSFTLTDDRIPLTRMTGDATVSNMLIDVRRLEADVLGGRITGTLQVTPGGKRAYQGKAYLRGIDLEAVSKVYILPESKDARLTGEGNLDLTFSGAKPPPGESPLSTLSANGEFEVLGGQFGTIPVLGEIAKRVGGGAELTVGEAAGVFDVADKNIHLRNAAVSSPALGVQGSGAIGFDRRLDLAVVAAPLGDWRDKVKQTNVPLLSDVAGEVAGAAQAVVNTATRGLLYEFRVTGTSGTPHVAAVPVPVVADSAAILFGGMARGQKDRRLLDAVRPADQAQSTHAPPPRATGTKRQK